MKKIINMKKLAIFTSLMFSVGVANIANAADEATTATSDATVTASATTTAEKNVDKTEAVQLNTGLRSLINSQKDAQTLLSDPSLNIDSTLGDLTKYSALTAVQEAKNKLEETASKGIDQQTQLSNAENASLSETQRLATGGQSSRESAPSSTASKDEKEVTPQADIKATAVYTLGNTGYAEIIYNGSKNVVRKGDKLPNGEIIESLTPLSVVIKDGDTKRTLPIVSGQTASSTQQGGRAMNANQQMGSDYTLTAPRMQ